MCKIECKMECKIFCEIECKIEYLIQVTPLTFEDIIKMRGTEISILYGLLSHYLKKENK